MSQTIIVSAVNLVEGGGLSVLIDCLSSMSVYASKYDYNIIALVNNKEIAMHDPTECPCQCFSAV